MNAEQTGHVDYYPDAAAWALLDAMTQPQVGHDLSSVINRIVAEWAKGPGQRARSDD